MEKPKNAKDMIPQEIEKFRLLAPMQIPELFNPDRLESVDDYGDYALLSYSLGTPMLMEKVLDRMEDRMNMNILYHAMTSTAAGADQHCCGYSSPMNGTMYKVNAQTGKGGLVRTVYVYIFDSLEVMLEYLKEDLEQHTGSFVVKSSMTLPALVADFM